MSNTTETYRAPKSIFDVEYLTENGWKFRCQETMFGTAKSECDWLAKTFHTHARIVDRPDEVVYTAEPSFTAKILVEGQEFINCVFGDNHRKLFDETVKKIGGEVALMVWKPRHEIWLRERLSITAPVEK